MDFLTLGEGETLSAGIQPNRYYSKNEPLGGGTWGTITGTLSSQTDLQTALNLKAPLASPTFTGTVIAPLHIGGTNTTSPLTLRSTSGIGTSGADIIFQTGNNGATEAMRIFNNGNVGIGTVSTGSKFEVAGLTTGGSLRFNEAGSLGSKIIFNTQGAEISNNGGANELLQANVPLGGAFYWNISQVGKMVLNSSGNLGIGVTSPVAKLNIISANLQGTNDLVFTNDASGNYRNGIANVQSSASASSNQMYFRLGDSTASGQSTVLTLGGDGNVGIGTTAPSATLHVLKTTEQLRLGYDATNYLSSTTSSVGRTILSPVSATSVGALQVNQSNIAADGFVVKAASNTPSGDIFRVERFSDTIALLRIRYDVGTGNANMFVNGNAAFGGTAVVTDNIITIASNTGNPSAPLYGANISRTVNLTADNAFDVTAGNFNVAPSGAAFNYTGTYRGGLFQASGGAATTKTVNAMLGGDFLIYNTTAGTVTTGAAGNFSIQNLNAAGVITNAYGLKVNVAFNSGTITNTYGVYVSGMVTGTQTNTPYNFYAGDSGAYNYFAGNVGIGTTAPTTGKLVVADTTLAGSAALAGSALNIAQTWNTTGTPTAIKLNVTDTASNAASLLMDLQVGGVSKFKVDKTGTVTGSNLSGTNTGDNAVNSNYSGLISNATHTGDATGATALTLATVNANIGSFTNANITVNAKGLITAASNGAGGAGTGITRSVNSISAPATAGATALTDYVYFVSGTTTLTLPTAVGNTNQYTVKNTGVATVTIATTSAQTIDGSATATLPVANTSLTFVSDNANWRIT